MVQPKRRLFITLAVILFVTGWFVFWTNPANWGVRASSRFEWERFQMIKPGDDMTEVVSSLGPPVRVINHNDSTFCANKVCQTYIFAARQSPWVVAYREAWVVVGPQGYVERTIVNQQP